MKQTRSILHMISVLAVLAGAVILSTGANAAGVVDVKSRGEIVRILVEEPGAYLDFSTAPPLLVELKIIGVAILFAGGKGVLKIGEMGGIGKQNGNFFIRSAGMFRNQGFVTAIIDGPTDRPFDLHGFRGSEDHAKDVAAVIAFLRKEYGLPVWLFGTSRGTNSVANAAVRLQRPKGPDGIVLTSTLLEGNSTGDQVLEYSLSKIRIPVVIAHHRKDSCSKTPPGNVEDLVDALKNAKILDVLWYEGGKPQGDECQAYHYHGFMGIELQVVNDIARAIKTTILGAR